MPIISNEDKEFLEYVAYKINTMLFASSPNEEPENKKIVDFAAYSKKVGYDIKAVKGNISATSPPNADYSDALQLNKEEQACISSEKEDTTMSFNIPNCAIGRTKRKDGRYQGYIVIKNHKYFVYGRTSEEVRCKIVNLIKNGAPKKKKISAQINGVPTGFNSFVTYYFEKFRKKKVSPHTLKCDINRYENHIKPFCKDKPIKSITPADCQRMIDRLSAMGKGKTAEEIYSLLSYIFRGAILHGIIDRNPLSIVYLERHESEHGVAFSHEEILELIEKTKNSICQPSYMILLCTGVRPNELATVRIEGNFIIAINSKRKNKKVEYKKIPIIEDLKPFLKEPLHIASVLHLRKQIKEFFPKHKLYDFRTTFCSVCRECGVAEPALKEFVGHSSGVLADSYTSLSDSYLLQEGKKISYNLTKRDF